ncbi:MAG: hypothetical protein U0414_38220 [Polyangiaceae bacterium]
MGAPPIRVAYFSSARKPGLASVEQDGAAAHRVDVGARHRGDAREVLDGIEALRSAVSNARAFPAIRISAAPGADALAV